MEDFFQNALEGLFIMPEPEPEASEPASPVEAEADNFFF